MAGSLLLVVVILKLGLGASLLIDEDDRAEDGDLGADACTIRVRISIREMPLDPIRLAGQGKPTQTTLPGDLVDSKDRTALTKERPQSRVLVLYPDVDLHFRGDVKRLGFADVSR